MERQLRSCRIFLKGIGNSLAFANVQNEEEAACVGTFQGNAVQNEVTNASQSHR